jgi:hypothetical protein
MAHELDHANTLPANLDAPAAVNGWRLRALIVAAIFGIIGVVLAFLPTGGFDHVVRAWLMGFMMCFSFAIGGLALLMVQHLTGGKWGLVVRRPLEAMSRTLPLVFLFFIPVGIFVKRLYPWAKFSDVAAALQAGAISTAEAHAIVYKRPMLNIPAFWVSAIILFCIWGLFAYLMNKWSLDRDRDAQGNTPYWRVKFENWSGAGVLIYALTMTAAVIYWVMSLDVTWYSSIWGLLFLVGQGYAVFALSILTVLNLSKYEPMRTLLRKTEQHDLGKLTFAFVMLNIYLGFSQFLIIWSGNLPEEIPWYLNRIRGHWGVIITLDFIFHWVIPFTLLLSRDLKRNKRRLAIVCRWMIFARCWDMFWLIEPNFPDARRNLHFSAGILEYAFIPTAMIAIWVAYYLTQLKTRPLIATNDPHLEEILQPEHVHA